MYSTAFADTVSSNKNTVSIGGEKVTTQTLTDNNSTRTVEVTDGNSNITASLNKTTNKLTINQDGKTFNIDLNQKKSVSKSKTSNIIKTDSYDDSSEVGSNSDDIWSYGYVEYQDSDSNIYYDVSDSSSGIYGLPEGNRVNSFVSYVDSLESADVAMIAAVPGSLVAAIVTFIAAAPETMGASALLAGLLAIGVGAAYYGVISNDYHCYEKTKTAYDIL